MLDCLLHEKIPLFAEVDILVIGAGSAGCCAAIAARKAGGFSTLLIERYGFAGGSSTQMLDTFYGFFTPGEHPRKVVGGIPDEIVDALDARKGVFLRPNTYGAGTGVNYNPELLKLVWDEQLAAAGVRTLFHTQLVDVKVSAEGLPKSAVVWTKRGFFRILAKRFIDASGDADFCSLAGYPFERAGDLDPAQTLTTTFRMSNVDLDAFAVAGGKKMLMARMEEAMDKGTHRLPRKAGSAHAMNAKGCISTVAVKVAEVDALDFEQLTEAEREGRRQAFVFEAFFRDCVPGYGESNIIGLSHQIGVRETRRVYGEYRLTRDDCLSARQFEDAVLLCGAPIEDHRQSQTGEDETVWAYVPGGRSYGVPYRTLVPRESDVVWVVGRCFSATHDAHASCRSMGQTMSMGQAAGAAAALSLAMDTSARELEAGVLRDRLKRWGAVLAEPETVAETAFDAWRKNRTFSA